MTSDSPVRKSKRKSKQTIYINRETEASWAGSPEIQKAAAFLRTSDNHELGNEMIPVTRATETRNAQTHMNAAPATEVKDLLNKSKSR